MDLLPKYLVIEIMKYVINRDFKLFKRLSQVNTRFLRYSHTGDIWKQHLIYLQLNLSNEYTEKDYENAITAAYYFMPKMPASIFTKDLADLYMDNRLFRNSKQEMVRPIVFYENERHHLLYDLHLTMMKLCHLKHIKSLRIDDYWDYTTLDFPLSIQDLKLESIYLRGINLSDFPTHLFNMKSIIELDLIRCKIKAIPNEISNLSKLTWLNIERNPNIILPPAINSMTVDIRAECCEHIYVDENFNKHIRICERDTIHKKKFIK